MCSSTARIRNRVQIRAVELHAPSRKENGRPGSDRGFICDLLCWSVGSAGVGQRHTRSGEGAFYLCASCPGRSDDRRDREQNKRDKERRRR